MSVRVGVIGIGNIGSLHADTLAGGGISGAVLTAVADGTPRRTDKYPEARAFATGRELIESGAADAVVVATPHLDHAALGCAALGRGLHVLVEKPLAVHKADAETLVAAYRSRPVSGQVFAIMLNQRMDPHFRRIRQLLVSGELGEVRRVQWTATEWFRPQAYYASAGWRGTWKGEGGGVLVNQCPHNLDMVQWLFGMPVLVRAFCHFGKWHDIETEDAVTAYFEFPNSATGVFVTSTGEAPGTDRLEIAADRGKLVLEEGRLQWTRNAVPMGEFCRTTDEVFGRPEVWNIEIPLGEATDQHRALLQNFVDAIGGVAPLVAPGEEGLKSVELANACLYSTLTDATVRLPLDGAAFQQRLEGLIRDSRFVKKPGTQRFATRSEFNRSHM